MAAAPLRPSLLAQDLAGDRGQRLQELADEALREGEDRAVAAAALGDQATVHNDLWTRQEDDAGRLYFFNRATGVSQWHVPNDLYVPVLWKDPQQQRAALREDFVNKMPGSARAVLDVDCVTQIRGPGLPHHVQEAKAKLMLLLANDGVHEEAPRQAIMPQDLLLFTVVRATGLRDADFMPGRDKSDPYCMVEIVGKDTATFRTAVVMDNLDPEWNRTELMTDYESGDILHISVWDLDDVSNVSKNATNLIDHELLEEDLYAQVNSDDCLGQVYLTPEDVQQAHGDEEVRFRLEDQANCDTEPFVYVKAKTLSGWPAFRGMPVPDVEDEINFAMPDLRIEKVEQAHVGSKVAAWDVSHQKGGYMGTYIGVFAKDVKRLRKGDEITCGRHRHTVRRIEKSGKINKKTPNDPIVYVHFEEDIDGVIRVGDTWTKVTKPATPGEFSDRVILYFDFVTSAVTNIPCIG